MELKNYFNAIKQECDYYKSKEHKEAVKIMVKVQNDLDKVKESYVKQTLQVIKWIR